MSHLALKSHSRADKEGCQHLIQMDKCGLVSVQLCAALLSKTCCFKLLHNFLEYNNVNASRFTGDSSSLPARLCPSALHSRMPAAQKPSRAFQRKKKTTESFWQHGITTERKQSTSRPASPGASVLHPPSWSDFSDCPHKDNSPQTDSCLPSPAQTRAEPSSWCFWARPVLPFFFCASDHGLLTSWKQKAWTNPSARSGGVIKCFWWKLNGPFTFIDGGGIGIPRRNGPESLRAGKQLHQPHAR